MLTILIVEDETALRDLIVRIVSERGFRVFAAANGHEAIRILGAHPVDLLFTDIVLPSMDGVQLAAQAKLMRPGIKVLFSTGYAGKANERNALRHGRVLYKPLRQHEVIREIEALLGAV